MIYAKIRENVVENLIELRRSNETDFSDYVSAQGLPIAIGDLYIDGVFYRGEKIVKTAVDHAIDQLTIISAAACDTVKSACIQTNTEPASSVGLFILGTEDWEPNKAYNRFDLVRYNGSIAWVKQAHTSQEAWLPFSIGTEAMYGARPEPDEDGVYPYVYNMAVEPGMKVRHEGVLYECIQGTDSLLFEPGQVPAMFKTLE